MSTLRQYTVWADVPAHLKTKTQLGRQGMRPGREQSPAATFCSYIWGTDRPRFYPLFDERLARPKRKMSPEQLANLARARELSKMARTCSRCGRVYPPGQKMVDQLCWRCRDRAEAVRWARAVLADEGAVILDTETTGLRSRDEVIEISIIDVAGNVLLDTTVKPHGEISPEASAIHGLTAQKLEGAPAWPLLHDRVAQILCDASRVVIYNAAFDTRLVKQTREKYGLGKFGVPADRFQCAMEWYAQFVGEWNDHRNRYRWQPLNGGHRALGDCKATLEVLREMARAE